MDIDGVLTNGQVTVDSAGNEFKIIHFKDLDAISEMKRQGLKVGLLSGEATPITLIFRERFKPDFFFNGCKDKSAALNKILAQTGFSADEVCYTGDGKYDIPIMKMVKFTACPSDAIREVRELAEILLGCKGGEGCCWELLEWILDQKAHES